MVSATSVERPEAMSCAPSGATPHSFHNPISLLTGIPHGEPSRREIGSGDYTRPGQNRVFSIEGPRPCALSLELPGAERSGEAYRRSLSHDCTIASSPLAELDACLDRMAAPILYEGKNPILIRFAPKAHFRNFL